MVTQDDALAERLRRLRLHGGAKQYFHDEVGFNSRLDTLQAAVLLAKLAASGRVERGTRPPRGALHRGVHRPPGRVPAPHRSGERAHLQPVHPPGAAPGRAPGAPQGAGRSATRSTIRCRSICSRASRISGTPQGSLPASEAASAQVISLPVYPGAHRGAAAGGHRRRARILRMTIAQDLIGRAERREALFGIVGLGYVGLPLAVELANAGFRVLGFDVQQKVVDGLNAGHSHVKDVTDAQLQAVVKTGRFSATTRHAPPRRAGRGVDLRADAALQVQGSGRQLHRRGHRVGQADAPPRPGRSSSRAPPIPGPRGRSCCRRSRAPGSRWARTSSSPSAPSGSIRATPTTAPGTRPRWSAASPRTASGWPWRSTSRPSTRSCRSRPPRRPSW